MRSAGSRLDAVTLDAVWQIDAMTQALRRIKGSGGPYRIRSGKGPLTGGLLDKRF